jgi:hypothetical protein
MIDFEIAPNLILASHITGVYDVNRNTTLANNDFNIVAAWAKSITALKLQGIIFHNNFSVATCKAHESAHIRFIKIDYDGAYNPNVYRYSIYSQFLNAYAQYIKNVFVTDVADVEVLSNPFVAPLYCNNPTALFCGDEPTTLNNDWMQSHGQHLRSKIPNYATIEATFKQETLLNCGIIGGRMEIMQPFINELWNLHGTYNNDNNTAYTGDMGAFNYLVRSKYNNNVLHGYPINTVFKKYETDTSCWFKHK